MEIFLGILIGILGILSLYVLHKLKRWVDFSKNQQELMRETQFSNLQILSENLHSGMGDLRRQMFDILNGYVNQISGKMDVFNHQVELRFGEINQQVNQHLIQGEEKNRDLFGEVIKRLVIIDQTQEQLNSLGGQIQNLQGILGNKQARGAFGEVQLQLLLEETLPPSQFYFQYTLTNGRRADCFLKLPNAIDKIVIDAKFPLENYRKKANPTLKETERAFFEGQFKLDIKKHIQDIAERYIIPGETAEGAIMFIPAEGVFADIHSHFMDLVEFSYKKKVWMVSPSTLMALLLTISTILKEVNTYEHAQEIKEQLAILAKEFQRFQERVDSYAKYCRLADENLGAIIQIAKKITKGFEQVASIKDENYENDVRE